MPFDVLEQYVAAAERALGVRFPASYREAMKCSNGGSIDAMDDDWGFIQSPMVRTRRGWQEQATASFMRRTASVVGEGFP